MGWVAEPDVLEMVRWERMASGVSSAARRRTASPDIVGGGGGAAALGGRVLCVGGGMV